MAITKTLDAVPEVVPAESKTTIFNSITSNRIQPQVFSMILITIILIVFAVVVYHKVKKQKPNVAPSGLIQATEMYVMGVDNLFKSTTENKFQKPGPYIFTLLTFLMVSNLMGMIGLEPPSSSFSTTLTLGLVSWIGIYVVGIMYQKLRFFKKFLNPLELITQFAPLISISFRLFGNLMAGSVIMTLIYTFTGYIWGFIPVIGEMNLLSAFIAPAFHIYFDLFDGIVQGFVFTLLTMIYWTLEAESVEPKKSKNKIKKQKQLRTINA